MCFILLLFHLRFIKILLLYLIILNLFYLIFEFLLNKLTLIQHISYFFNENIYYLFLV